MVCFFWGDGEWRVRSPLLRHMARACAGQLVGVDEKSAIQIAGIQGQHAVVDILLRALAVVAGGQQAARRVGEEARLQPRGLRVVVLTVAVALRHVLHNNPPEALHVHGPLDLRIVNVGGAEVALRSDPVRHVVGRRSLGGARVVLVVESLLLRADDLLDEVIGRLVGLVCVLLEEERV